jgi:thiol-disulfide isomerase/thioredoxin
LTVKQPEDKDVLQDIYKKVMDKDSRIATNPLLAKFVILEKTQQACFSLQLGGQKTGILGISRDNGKSWHFTQFISEFNYSQIKELFIPELDSSFISFDAAYYKRIGFSLNKPVKPFEFVDFNGNLLKSEDLRGKVIVLNFWSTSCRPCVAEIPKLNELVRKMKDKNIVFIAPAFYDTKEYLNGFLQSHPFEYIIVLSSTDFFNVKILPTHIIIDSTQKVVGYFTGGNQENLVKIESILNNL